MIEQYQCFWVPHLTDSGVVQMALDESLAEWLRIEQSRTPILIARTYRWSEQTLSLGVHQPLHSIQEAYAFYSQGHPLPLVKRPTGGRAILHGEDISFAFITNIPEVLKLSLNDSYCIFTTWIRKTIEALDIPLKQACDSSQSDYMLSSLCFETKTPSDLTTPSGEKVAGSAQLRRQGAILQHGAAFLKPFSIDANRFDQTLFHTLEGVFAAPIITLDPQAEPAINTLRKQLQKDYASEATSILDKLATTSGSHLLPASD